MYKVFLIVTLLFFSFFECFAQISFTGSVKNDNGELLKEAMVYCAELNLAEITDNSGVFRFQSIPSGKYSFKFSFLGFQDVVREVDLRSDLHLDIILPGKLYNFDEFEVIANKLQERAPFSFVNLGTKEIRQLNQGQDMPYILQLTPSLVPTSDAGAGIGYTGIRLRGIDQTRINVTVNGIPINDAESQGVFWVNMPDFASSLESIQIQRGVGSSTIGTGAFGGAVVLNTFSHQINPSIEANVGGGSFDTRRYNLKLNSGLIGKHYNIDFRISGISSDGYIDRASTDMRSWYLSASRVTDKSSLRFISFAGNERTYQAWWGVPEAKIKGDADALIQHYFNNVGSIYFTAQDSVNLFDSDRRYNYYTHPNQVDDYSQSHYQLHYSRQVSDRLSFKTALNYTRGLGFFEEFKHQQFFGDYLLNDFIDANGDLVSTGNVIRRRWLDNHMAGAFAHAVYEASSSSSITAGVAYYLYKGDHYGNVVGADPNPGFDGKRRYYENNSTKSDLSTFVKWDQKLGSQWSLYTDVQLRQVSYQVDGVEYLLNPVNIDTSFLFFNPKAGITFSHNQNRYSYLSVAVANREPVRSDFLDNPRSGTPLPEHMINIELGHHWRWKKHDIGFNVYHMNYRNQLVPNGDLNQSGEILRTNVPASTRTGLEAYGRFLIMDDILLTANATWSRNKIDRFTEVLFDYTDDFDRIENEFRDTDIAFAPSFTAATALEWRLTPGIGFMFQSRYVSSQFLDNTSNVNRQLPAYHFHNLLLNYQPVIKGLKNMEISLMVNNIFNQLYSSNGYTYSYVFGDLITENFYYPQAGRNFLLNLSVRI